MPTNPYTNRSMIRDPKEFFGRHEDVSRMYSLISRTQSVSVVGERRIGKSSLLYCCAHPDVRTQFPDYDLQGCRFVYFDAQSSSWLGPDDFLHLLADSVADKCGIALQSRASEASGYARFSTAIETSSKGGLKPVLLLDEFDALMADQRFDAGFFGFLRAMANGSDLALVTATHTRLQKLCRASLAKSPFFNIFNVIPLEPFTREEALDLVRMPASQAGCPFTDQETQFALEWAGTHPFFLQLVCYELWAVRTKADRMADHELAAVAARFTDQADDHFEYRWTHLDADKRTSLLAAIQDDREQARSTWGRGFLDYVERAVGNTIESEHEKKRHNWFKGLLGRKSFYVGVGLIVVCLILAFVLDAIEALLIVIGTVIALAIDEIRRGRQEDAQNEE